MKTCTKCKESKPRSEFHNCSSKRDGKFSACKECRNSRNREYAEQVGHAELYRRAVGKNPEAYRQKNAEYYRANKDKIKARAKEWSKANPERKKQNSARHYADNRETYIQKAAEWARDNNKKRTEICMGYMRRMRKERPREFVAVETARKMLARVLVSTGRKKRGRTFDALGYNRQQFEQHIESLFEEGMSWPNHGEWHIDHIIPVSELVRCGVTDPAKINALSNLRPIWAAENMAKRDHFELSPPECSHITRASR